MDEEYVNIYCGGGAVPGYFHKEQYTFASAVQVAYCMLRSLFTCGNYRIDAGY